MKQIIFFRGAASLARIVTRAIGACLHGIPQHPPAETSFTHKLFLS